PAHALQRDLNAALFADDVLVLHPLVLAAQALVVLDRPEDARAEQAVAFGLERPVIDRFRLLDLAERPGADLLRRSDRDFDLVEHRRRGVVVEGRIDQVLVHRVHWDLSPWILVALLSREGEKVSAKPTDEGAVCRTRRVTRSSLSFSTSPHPTRLRAS